MENVDELFSHAEHRTVERPAEEVDSLFSSGNSQTVVIGARADLAAEIESLFVDQQLTNQTVCLPSALNESLSAIVQPQSTVETDEQILQRILKFYSQNVLTARGLRDLLSLVVKSAKNPGSSIPETAYLFKKIFGSELKASFSFTTPCCDRVVYDFKAMQRIECPADGCEYDYSVKTIINNSDYSFRCVIGYTVN